MIKLEIVHSLDEFGFAIVTVPLRNSKRSVTMYAQDFDMLTDLGVTFPWFNRQDTICFWSNKKSLAIARILIDAGPRETVSYINRNSCDLRNNNLIRVKGGPATHRTRDLIVKSFKPMRYEIVHVRERTRDYKGFQVTDRNLDDRWIITKEGKPVDGLLGTYTRLTVAKNCIDDYLNRGMNGKIAA